MERRRWLYVSARVRLLMRRTLRYVAVSSHIKTSMGGNSAVRAPAGSSKALSCWRCCRSSRHLIPLLQYRNDAGDMPLI